MLTVGLMRVAVFIGTVIVGTFAAIVVFGVLAQVQSGNVANAEAVAACQAISDKAGEYGTITGVQEAERSTAGDVATWQEERLAAVMDFQSDLRKLNAAQAVDVCIFTGQFVTPAGVDSNGNPNPPHTRLRLLIMPDGSVKFESAGYADRMQPDLSSDVVGATAK